MSSAVLTLSSRSLPLPLRAMSDAQLARLAACGDRRALSGIFERHHQALYRYCRSLVGNDTDAQDALQSTMVRVVRALPGEQREISLKAWLYRIAHNESLRILGARRPHAPLDEAPELPAPDETAGTEARERLAALVADLQQLPERARSALVMRELNGASFQEIGETFGISPAAAKQAVYEARIALQDFEAGRAMNCDDVTRAVSDGDGRRLRQRKMRAHLRACDDCRAFQAALQRRGADFRALAPPLAPAVAAGLLADLLGGSGGGTAAAAGLAATATTKAGGGATGVAAAKMTTAAAAAAKGAAVAAVTVAAGAGVLHATAPSEPPPREPVVARTASAQQAATPARSTAVARRSRPETSRQPARRAEKRRRATEERRRSRAATRSRDTQAIGGPPGGPTRQGGRAVSRPRRVAAPPAGPDNRGVPGTAPAPNPRVRPTVPRPAPVPDVGIEAPVPTAAPAPAPAPPAPAPAATPDAPDVTDGATGATKKFPE